MAIKALLALNKIEEFTTWAESQGYRREPTKGELEVLRLRQPGQRVLIFSKQPATKAGGQPQHASGRNGGATLIRKWLASRREPKP